MPIDLTNKAALLDCKQKLLDALSYNDMRMKEVREGGNLSAYFEDDSSDSDTELGLPDIGPSVNCLKLQKNKLMTGCQATQELTSLIVLQSEVVVLAEPPLIDGEPPVEQEGTWREVTAECRIDIVPFSIIFYVHKSDRQFSPISHRGLRVLPVRASHEAELARSVLHGLTRPADAVQVLRSYAASCRSRRGTLAALAERYGSALHMEPHPQGGFVLKCANLLEVAWSLENKWSPVAPFHHRMKFDLEYMDENYINIISQAHKQLSDPTLSTDERTLILSKIISTCLEAQGPTTDLYESFESDQESIKRNKTVLDQEIDNPIKKLGKRTTIKEPEDVPAKKKRDAEVMAPPKSLPKKVKPKGKENTVSNKAVKRASSNKDVDNVKKAKVSAEIDDDERKLIERKTGNEKTVKLPKEQKNTKESLTNDKQVIGNVNSGGETNTVAKKSTTEKIKKTQEQVINTNIKSNTVKAKNKFVEDPNTNNPQPITAKKKARANKNEDVTAKNNVNSKHPNPTPLTDIVTKDNNKNQNIFKNNAPQTGNVKSNPVNTDNENNSNDNNKSDKVTKPNAGSREITKKSLLNKQITKNNKEIDIHPKPNNNVKETTKSKTNITKKQSNDKLEINTKQIPSNTKGSNQEKQKSNEKIQMPNNPKKIQVKNSAAIKKNAPAKNTENTTMQRVTEKNVAVKHKDHLMEIVKHNSPSANLRNSTSGVKNKAPLKLLNKYTVPSKKISDMNNGIKSVSKIPQKAVNRISENYTKRNPLRISPRMVTSKFLSPAANVKMLKTSTNIPRLQNLKNHIRKS